MLNKIELKQIIRLYNNGMTTDALAEKYGVCGWTIRDKLKKENQILRPRGKRLNTLPLSNLQKQIIDGEILGDAHVYLGKNYRNACLMWHQKYLEHNLFLRDALSVLNPKIKKRHNVDGYTLFTSCHPYITQQHKRWYPNGKKIVPLDFKLTPTSCFHWYIGDGYFNEQGYIELYSLCFTGKENMFLVEKLLEKNIKSAHVVKKRNKKYPFYIRIGNAGLKPFFKYIGEPKISCYNYKWGLCSKP